MPASRTIVRIELPTTNGRTVNVISCQVESDELDVSLSTLMELIERCVAGCGFHADCIQEAFHAAEEREEEEGE